MKQLGDWVAPMKQSNNTKISKFKIASVFILISCRFDKTKNCKSQTQPRE